MFEDRGMWIYIAILACAAAIALRIYHYDCHEREPRRMAFLALALGFVVMSLAGLVEQSLLSRMRLSHEELIRKAALVAMVEDGAKLLVVLAIAYVFHHHVNDPLDGVVYGTLVGLGAGLEESLMYLSFTPPSFDTLGCEITRLLAHSMFGGLVGFAVGFGARPDGSRRRAHPILLASCVALAMTVHFTWDLIAYQPGPKTTLVRAGLMGLMVLLTLSWGWMVVIAKKRSQLVFAESAIRNPQSEIICARPPRPGV
jgi:RsiW-degrading membrane proteinase PrsW (M82 family)